MDITININILNLSITILALFLAWRAFKDQTQQVRNEKLERKKAILTSIDVELKLMYSWLGTSYNEALIEASKKTWAPLHMVYSIGHNEAVKTAINSSEIILLSDDLIESLVTFNQLLSNFEQHNNIALSMNTGNPLLATEGTWIMEESLTNKEGRYRYINNLFLKFKKNDTLNFPLTDVEKYLVGTHIVMVSLHARGIGSSDDPKSLNTSFSNLNNLVEAELVNLDYEQQWKNPKWYRYIDFGFKPFLSIAIAGVIFFFVGLARNVLPI